VAGRVAGGGGWLHADDASTSRISGPRRSGLALSDGLRFVVMTNESAQVELVNAYQWIGDPRLARFHLYVDGKKVGSARPVGGACRTEVAPGSHTARIRFHWCFSPSSSFEIASGQNLRLTGDIQRELSIHRRMASMAVHPLSSLTLQVEESAEP
jgi:hypothetical protein